MHCPNCGSSILADQQFCRSCGAGLKGGEARILPGRSVPVLMLVIMFCGIMIAIGGGMAEIKLLTFIGVAIALAGMFMIPAYSLMGNSRPRKRKNVPTPHTSTIESADTTNKLLPIGQNEFIPSITEGTTNLLKTPSKKI